MYQTKISYTLNFYNAIYQLYFNKDWKTKYFIMYAIFLMYECMEKTS